MIGCMFSGYRGLSMAVADLLGMDVAWHAEIEPAACRVLAHHWPDVPNLGDVTTIDWTAAPPVDVITAGFPCQDLSYAGKGAGIREGTRSGLWSTVATAVRHLGPRLVVLENVSSIVARRPGLDVVLDDLARLGYDVRWTTVRAADVGACHRRDRWFAVAHPTDLGCEWGGGPRVGGTRPADNCRPVALLPSPAVNDMGRAYTPEEWDAWTDRMKAAHGNGNGHGKSLEIEAQRLPPTPKATNNENRPSPGFDNNGETFYQILHDDRWGDYAAAIARHEQVLGRPAPPPTKPGRNGRPRLSAEFVTWMMMLPKGHVTDVPDVSHNQALKMLGNGVVPQQATEALSRLLSVDLSVAA